MRVGNQSSVRDLRLIKLVIGCTINTCNLFSMPRYWNIDILVIIETIFNKGRGSIQRHVNILLLSI